jgi:hypothetical protein
MKKKKKRKVNWMKKADKLWSELILQAGSCEKCGSRTNLQAHHLIGRRNYNYRYDLSNGICLCKGCHTMSNGSAHGSLHHDMNGVSEFIDWLKENRFGQWVWYEEHRKDKGFNKPDFEEHYRTLLAIKNARE